MMDDDSYSQAAREGVPALNAWDRDNYGPGVEDEEEFGRDDIEAMHDAYLEDRAVEDSRGVGEP